MKLHPSITPERVCDLAEQSMFGAGAYYGICVKCGEETDGVEPDARGYKCHGCGDPQGVFGAEELLNYV